MLLISTSRLNIDLRGRMAVTPSTEAYQARTYRKSQRNPCPRLPAFAGRPRFCSFLADTRGHPGSETAGMTASGLAMRQEPAGLGVSASVDGVGDMLEILQRPVLEVFRRIRYFASVASAVEVSNVSRVIKHYRWVIVQRIAGPVTRPWDCHYERCYDRLVISGR